MFSVGDMVKICDDLQRLKEWQVGHGEYIDAMKGVSSMPSYLIFVHLESSNQLVIPFCTAFQETH